MAANPAIPIGVVPMVIGRSLLFILAIILGSPTMAGTLEVLVQNGAGQAVGGVVVHIEAPGFSSAVISKHNGRTKFLELAPGKYVVKPMAAGRNTEFLELTFQDDDRRVFIESTTSYVGEELVGREEAIRFEILAHDCFEAFQAYKADEDMAALSDRLEQMADLIRAGEWTDEPENVFRNLLSHKFEDLSPGCATMLLEQLRSGHGWSRMTVKPPSTTLERHYQ